MTGVSRIQSLSERPLAGKQIVSTFAVGFVIGVAIAYVIVSPRDHYFSRRMSNNFLAGYFNKQSHPDSEHETDYKYDSSSYEFPAHDGIIRNNKNKTNNKKETRSENEDPHEGLDEAPVTIPSIRLPPGSPDEDYHRVDDSVAQKLQDEIRVVCFVMTIPENHKEQATNLKNTWGSRCTWLIFISHTNDSHLGAISFPHVKQDIDHKWAKTKETFKYAWEEYRYEANWFLKADDDTYVVMENLRLLLSENNPKDPIYHGFRMKPYVKQGYMSGGAGYVLSKEALERLVKQGLPNKDKCRASSGGSEDIELGKCLENVGVKAGDSRDSLGRFRFLPFTPEYHLIPGFMPKDFWLWKSTYYPHKEGFECCSDRAITFHFVSAKEMLGYEYLLYHLQTFGISQVQSGANGTHIGQKQKIITTPPSSHSLATSPRLLPSADKLNVSSQNSKNSNNSVVVTRKDAVLTKSPSRKAA